MKERILFLVKKRDLAYSPYSPPFGLLYSAQFVTRMLNRQGKEAKLVQVVDGNSIDKEVTDFDPSIVVIEALWATPEKIKELLNISRHKRRTWVVRLHSKPSFIAFEGMAMEWISAMADMVFEFPNFKLSVNNPQAADEYRHVFHAPISLLPNFYKLPDSPVFKREATKDSVNIGCFGALRPLKNTLEQAFGAIIYANRVGKKLNFFINSNRIEQHAEPILKNLRALFEKSYNHRLIEVEWKTHSDFLGLVKLMDLGLQVSFSESFNIVTADFVANGIPIVVSNEVYWMPNSFKANTTDAFDIAAKLDYVNTLPKCISRNLMKFKLDKYNHKSKKLWLRFINRN